MIFAIKALACYRDGLYVCRAASSGADVECINNCSGGAGENDDYSLICWRTESTGYVTRAANGAISGSMSICNGNMNCTYTIIQYDCSGFPGNPTTANVPTPASYSCGGSCSPS